MQSRRSSAYTHTPTKSGKGQRFKAEKAKSKKGTHDWRLLKDRLEQSSTHPSPDLAKLLARRASLLDEREAFSYVNDTDKTRIILTVASDRATTDEELRWAMKERIDHLGGLQLRHFIDAGSAALASMEVNGLKPGDGSTQWGKWTSVVYSQTILEMDGMLGD